MRPAGLPDAERLERGNGTRKQRRGTIVRSGWRRDQDRVDTRSGERKCAQQTNWSAADNDDLSREVLSITHNLNQYLNLGSRPIKSKQ
jgi:hypothetical protein